ncbi:hypothetical protein EV356DRAFT_513939 [Viridothelium virens]|uniref:Glycine-rich domain-containing protein 1 n=1 Tax=Viridothelium virens TaxID=1048519 RepID=A0A6A6HNS0_VIRVR|nr:hypothetical protein EV356DRAFT_513939 [Viridothelium virens]
MSAAQEKESPPAYDEELEHLNQQFDSLTLSPSALPSVDHCIAHLKFLHSLHILREDVATNDALFDIASPHDALVAAANDNDVAKMRARVREKRWQVYVTRAVARFAVWMESCVPKTRGGKPQEPLRTADLAQSRLVTSNIALQGSPTGPVYSEQDLPPLDILMVWHAHLLNPRCFFEDCLRHGRLDFYAAYFPWQIINSSIDNKTLEYDPKAVTKEKFERDTGLRWDNLDEGSETSIRCPNCNTIVRVPYTRASGYASKTDYFYTGTGLADEDFKQPCPSCGICLSHAYARVQKFRRDMQLLLKDDIPLPGTCTGTNGLPIEVRVDTSFLFASLLAKTSIRASLLEACDPRRSDATMEDIKKLFESAVTNSDIVSAAKSGSSRLVGSERVSIRRVMSRYWYNSSPFALDLVGAVIRQGTFVDKMFRIDWLHSPSLKSTMSRSLKKYLRFWQLMVSNPKRTAVPTLDIDLAWHTHQLNPKCYYAFSHSQTHKLVDHDDKIEEQDLSDAFEWTSKTYQKTFGEVYSECNCWYCESIREAHTSGSDKLFSRTKHKALEAFHSSSPSSPSSPSPCTQDPTLGPHLSAHNVVRRRDSATASRLATAQHTRRMNALYGSACERARKKGWAEPRRDDYMYAYAWGYPLYYPLYMPYYVDPCISASSVGSTGVYAADPCAVDMAPVGGVEGGLRGVVVEEEEDVEGVGVVVGDVVVGSAAKMEVVAVCDKEECIISVITGYCLELLDGMLD